MSYQAVVPRRQLDQKINFETRQLGGKTKCRDYREYTLFYNDGNKQPIDTTKRIPYSVILQI